MAKKKVKQPRPSDVLHYGTAIAELKASMPHKRWARFVKSAHKRGFTVEGALSDVPDALKERTRSSIRKQASRTVARQYKPVYRQLDAQQASIKALDTKRQQDEQAYQTWLSGQAAQIGAAARAADATLATQQAQIQQTNRDDWTAAIADSMKRAGLTPGNVSNPQQSTALNAEAAAAQHSDQMVQNARQQSAQMMATGEDVGNLSRAALMANAAAEQAKRMGDTWTELAKVSDDKNKAKLQQAADAASMVQDLLSQEVSKASTNQQNDIAAASLGEKKKELALKVKTANRNFKLAERKLKLSTWEAHHKNLTDKAKIQLGYDQIKERKGKAAADRALRKWVTKYQQTHEDQRNNADNATSRANAKDRAKGKNAPTAGERKNSDTMYQQVESARDFIDTQISKGRTLAEARARLSSQKHAPSAPVIALAVDLRLNNGRLSSSGKKIANNIGIIKPNKYWPAVHLHKPNRTGGKPSTGAAGYPTVGAH